VTDIWSRLGIAATTDLKAIKSAYAARLKVTRPDDDAAAWQALREAYEAAQTEARWRQARERQDDHSTPWQAVYPAAQMQAQWTIPPEAASLDDTASASQQDESPGPAEEEESSTPRQEIYLAAHMQARWTIGPEPAAPAEQDDTASDNPQADPPPAWRDPAELAQALKTRLDSREHAAIIAEWKMLESELDKLPLSAHDDASRSFADAVLAAEGNPPLAVRNALLRRFGWLDDFRATQTLGWQRAHDLRSFFGSGASFRPDEAFLNRYRDVCDFAQDVQALRGWRQRLYIMLADSRIRRLWKELKPVQRDVMDIERVTQEDISNYLVGSWFIWLALITGLALGVLAFMWKTDAEWMERFLSMPFVCAMGWSILAIVIRLRDGFQRLLLRGSRGWLWRGIPVWTLIATACLGAAPFCIMASNHFPFFEIVTAILVVLSFMLAQWPHPGENDVAPWVLLLYAIVGISIFDLTADWRKTDITFGALWFMLSLLVCNYRPQWLELKPYRHSTFLAKVIANLIAWPGVVLLWARQQAPAPVVAASFLALAAVGGGQTYLLFPAWVIFTLVLLGLDQILALCRQKIRG
jgi:hypothetical protein